MSFGSESPAPPSTCWEMEEKVVLPTCTEDVTVLSPTSLLTPSSLLHSSFPPGSLSTHCMPSSAVTRQIRPAPGTKRGRYSQLCGSGQDGRQCEQDTSVRACFKLERGQSSENHQVSAPPSSGLLGDHTPGSRLTPSQPVTSSWVPEVAPQQTPCRSPKPDSQRDEEHISLSDSTADVVSPRKHP